MTTQPRDAPSAEAMAAARKITLYGPPMISSLCRENERRMALAIDAFAARRVAEAISAEREACAKVVDHIANVAMTPSDKYSLGRCLHGVAQAIRGRWEQSHE